MPVKTYAAFSMFVVSVAVKASLRIFGRDTIVAMVHLREDDGVLVSGVSLSIKNIPLYSISNACTRKRSFLDEVVCIETLTLGRDDKLSIEACWVCHSTEPTIHTKQTYLKL